MPMHTFTLGGSAIKGFSVDKDGTVHDFDGTLNRCYNSLARASAAARRKYKDSSITITEITRQKRKFQVDLDELLKIATEV